jgi:hypothetical protein
VSAVLLAIGTRKGLWLARSDEQRQRWTLGEPAFLAREIPAVAIDGRDGQTRLLVGVRSEHWGPTVMWSDDLGERWQETEHGGIRFPDDTGAALARVWQLQPDPSCPGVVWAGCEPTSLWRSADGGRSFELVRGLWDHPHRASWEPGFGGAAVHTVLRLAPNRILAAMSTGGVYLSDDEGTSWHPANNGISAYFLPDPNPEFGQCVHKVAADPSGRLYAQNHHGVYRSDDGAASWQSIAAGLPSDFGFSILAHPRQPGTAWVVPLAADAKRVPPDGRLRVYRTNDAGESWKESQAGLPDGCWISVLRDAACLDDAEPVGVYLGTRDGCLWASADEGATFSLVAAHLPDVLSVRAARLHA